MNNASVRKAVKMTSTTTTTTTSSVSVPDQVGDAEGPSACLLQTPHTWKNCDKDHDGIRQLWLYGKEVSLGRSPDSTICFKYAEISRRHAIFRKLDDGTWILRDSRSANGVFINEHRLSSTESHVMEDGDVVHLGPPGKTVFEYRFLYLHKFSNGTEKEQHVPNLASSSMPKNDLSEGEKGQRTLGLPPNIAIRKWEEDSSVRSSRQSSETSSSSSESHSIAETNSMPHVIDLNPVRGPSSSSFQGDACLELHNGGSSMSHENDVQSSANESPTPCGSAFRTKNEASHSRDSSNVAEISGIATRLKEIEALLKEKEELQRALEQSIKEKEKHLQRLKAKDEEEDVTFVGMQVPQLEHPPDPVMEIVIDDDDAQAKEQQHHKAMDITEEFEKVMDSELTCSICSELFVKATTLQCSHTFCAQCITRWKVNKKICPICRTRIVKETRVLVVDNFIDRIVENLGPEAKKRRLALVAEREASTKKQNRRGGSRGRASSRRRRGGSVVYVNATTTSGAQRFTAAGLPSVSISIEEDAIEVSSDSDSEVSFDQESDLDSFDGSHLFCYFCGIYGHSSDACDG